MILKRFFQTRNLERGFASYSLLSMLAVALLLLAATAYMGQRFLQSETSSAETGMTKPETVVQKQDDSARWASLSDSQPVDRTPNTLSRVSKNKADAQPQALKGQPASDNEEAFKLTPQMEQELLALLPKASESYTGETALWRTDQPVLAATVGGATGGDVPAKRVRANPDALAALQVGDTLDLPGYDGEASEGATIESRRQLKNGLSLMEFKVNDGSDLTGGQAVIGKKSTEVSYVTRNGTYTLNIDNKTGEGTLISDADLRRRYQNGSDIRVKEPEVPEVEPENG